MSENIGSEPVRNHGGVEAVCACGPAEGCPLCTLREGEEFVKMTRAGLERVKGDSASTLYSTQNSFLLGKVLTVVEAAIIDRGQLKAVKDLIRQQFREQEKWVHDICGGSRLLVAAGEETPPA